MAGLRVRSGQPITASLAQRWRDVLLDPLRETLRTTGHVHPLSQHHSSFLLPEAAIMKHLKQHDFKRQKHVSGGSGSLEL